MAHEAAKSRLLRTIDLGPDSLLYFVHIPKTAGSSLYSYLDTLFLPNQVFPADRAIWHQHYLAKLPAQSINDYSCLRGHLYHAQLQRFWQACRRKVVPFTILRDPESQLLSEYDMVLHDENVPMRKEAAERKLSFADFLREPAYFGHVLDNPHLKNATPGDRQAAHLLLQFESDPYAIPKDEWFDRVVEKLEGYALVGTQESFDRSLQLLSYIFGWICPHRPPHLNRMRGKKAEISAEDRALIAELNGVDLRLYEWAAARFEKQYAEMLARLGLDADAPGISQAITAASGLRLAERLKATSGDPRHVEVVFNHGLLLGHVSPSRPRTLNWIGPDREATCRMAFASSGNRLIHIEFVHWVSRRLLRGFQVFVNGRNVPLVAYHNDELATFVGYLPESWIGTPGSIVDVQLVAAESSSPAIEGTNLHDPERKCLGLSALQFLPIDGPMVR